jgi:biopolymer transport protein ExbD
MALPQIKQSTGSPLAEINMIPLIDVMLVLLVIFIVTAPLLTHAVRIELPRVSSTPTVKQPDTIALAIDAQGEFFWNGERVARGDLQSRLDQAGKQSPQPALHLSVEKTTEYQVVAEILGGAARAGLSKIGFVSDPRESTPADKH